MMAVKPEAARTYGGETARERAARRRDALLDAALDLVAADGWRSLSIDALCRHAGLNKRYFYEGFGELDDLTAALTRRLADDAIAPTLAAMADETEAPAIVRSAITAFVEHLTADPRRARVLFGAVPAADAAAAHRVQAIRRIVATVAGEGGSLHALSDTAFLETISSMLVGGTGQAVLDWLDGAIECSRDEFVEHVAALWLAVDSLAAARALGDARPAPR